MKAKRGVQNLISAFASQFVTIVLGFIIPRITLVNYGSEINGVMSLVAQIYTYIALLEAGLGTAALQALYAPVTHNDRDEISGIVNAATKYYKKIALYYALAVVGISVVLPFIIDSQLSYWEISLYFLFFGVSNVINFCFTAAMRPILLAEGKNYVNNNITLIFHVISQFAKVLLLVARVNIVVLQLFYSAINISQIAVYYLYFKKNYGWLDKNAKPRFEKIQQRNAFLIQQVSRLLFSCVDIIIITFLCDLKSVSVYTIYLLIFDAIGRVLSILSSSTQFILAQSYNDKPDKYVPIHRGYETVFIALGFALYSVAFVLAIPFIKIYTAGVTDINYIDNLLPLLFTVIGVFTVFKTVPLCIINFTFHAKQTLNRTLTEAGINLTLSIALAFIMGMRGVLLATCIALVYRVIDSMIYVNKKILNTTMTKSLKLYIGNTVAFVVVVILKQFIPLEFSNYVGFIIYGVAATVAFLIYFSLVNILLDVKQSKILFNILKRKLLKR